MSSRGFGAVLAVVCSLGAANVEAGEAELASKVYASGSEISNIGFIPGGTDLAVLERKTGRVMRVPLGGGEPSVLLDISARLKSTVVSEQGLLGIAFQPDFEASGTLYVVYTNRYNQWTLSRFTAGLREEILIQIDRYVPWHACGQIEFHPIDGQLYACLGDADRQGSPSNTSGNLELLHGKILRIDVVNIDSGYVIPADNPYLKIEGARPEIWASGLRNPWQFSFDRRTGDAMIPDVGWNTAEEINFLKYPDGAGTNFGWPEFEGERAIPERMLCDSGACAKRPFAFPIFTYDRKAGNCAVIGGTVYRGSRFPEWDGTYLYTDMCTRLLSGLRFEDGRWERTELGRLPMSPVAIRSGRDGDVFIAGRVAVWRLDLSQAGARRWEVYQPRIAVSSDLKLEDLQGFTSLRGLAELIASDTEKIFVMSVRDEAKRSLSQLTTEKLSALGLKFGELRYRGSFAAVIRGGVIIAQQVNNSGSVTLESDELKALGIDRVYSAGYPFGNASSIVIDGVDLSPNTRGVNLVILEGDTAQIGHVDSHLQETVSQPGTP